MVQIVGSAAGSEREAAERLAAVLRPRLNPEARILIVVGAKCYGHDVQDIDLLILGTFGKGLNIASDGEAEILLINLALIIEVKEHTFPKLEFCSQHVWVEYRQGWEDATDKVFKQSATLPKFLKSKGHQPPWISSLIWLVNYQGDLPSSIDNVVTAHISVDDFFAAVRRVRPPVERSGRQIIACTKNDKLSSLQQLQRLQGFFTQAIKATPMDRKRVESICKRLIADQKYAARLGNQLLAFRGRAGSGKTVHLLRLAKDLYDQGHRILLLTYNLALVADVRRLLAIIGVENDGERVVRIMTAHSFFGQLHQLWNLASASLGERGYSSELYQSNNQELCTLMEGESTEALQKELWFRRNINTFGWDHIFVDEAQDWFDQERDLLFTLFGPEKIVLADGIDQLLRRRERCEWYAHLDKASKQVVYLRRALRMGSPLCRIIAAFALHLGVEWSQEPNEENLTGQVTVVEGPYTPEVHKKVMEMQKADGNEPVDALFCVGGKSNGCEFSFADELVSWGYQVWDGTSREERASFPTSVEEHRVVHYQSCRGLEGWTVVCLGLDTYYEMCLKLVPNSIQQSFQSPDEQAGHFAGQHILMPLSRAMQHLVIQLDGRGKFAEICSAVHSQFPDLIEWLKPSSDAAVRLNKKRVTKLSA